MRQGHATSAPVDVLIVENDETTRAALRRLLEEAGYACTEAAGGTEALEAARQRPPRLVLLDLLLPGPDSLEVGRRLRADPRTRQAPFLFLNGRDDPAALLELVALALHEPAGPPGDPNAGAGAEARVAAALHAMGPRWLRQSARWLEEHVAPHHPNLPLLLRLTAHLRHAARLAEVALAAAGRYGAGRADEPAAHRGPHERGQGSRHEVRRPGAEGGNP